MLEIVEHQHGDSWRHVNALYKAQNKMKSMKTFTGFESFRRK